MIKSYGFWSLSYDNNNKKNYDYKTYKHDIELHYSHKLKKWVKRDEFLNDGDSIHWFPSGYPCNSLKSALRHLRKHSEIPNGTRFRLVSRYIGCDIILTKKG